MGEVWQADDTRLNRHVALKMVCASASDDESARALVMREARAAAALNHPHIATIHDVIDADGRVVIVFEFVEGETLHMRLARGPIPAPEAVRIALQIAKALAAAHAVGVVHRDLKPANVIIGADGHVKVLDFGVARVLAVGTTQAAGGGAQTLSGGGFVGTASYAAPEQMVSASVDERADLYALGVVLFEMVSGERPFAGHDTVALATAKLGSDAPPLTSPDRDVPPQLARLVAALLDRDRDKRPATATEVIAQLREIYGAPTAVSPPRPGTRWPLVASAALLIALLGGYAAWRATADAPAAGSEASAPPVVAVLPLANMSGDESRNHIAAGIAESLISSLAAVPSVTVLSRASVIEARGRTKDNVSLQKDLGATFLVDGSVQESSGTVRVSLSLIRSDRSVAWAEVIEGSFERIFELQSRLASALTGALVVRLTASDRERMNVQPTSSPDALAAYWQGSALLERSDIKGNVDAAISAFQKAASLDRQFALAHVGLGQAYRRKYIDTRDGTWAQRAIEEASIALKLDPDRAEVRYVLALTLAGGGRLSEAVDELNRALAIRPNYEEARRELGAVLAQQQQLDAAVVEFRRAIALRPGSPHGHSAMGLALFRASRYEAAAQAFEEMVKAAPDSFLGYQQLGTAYQLMGRDADALLNYERSIAIQPSPQAYTNIGSILHERGDFAGAVKAYEQALALRPNAVAAHRNLGDALVRLGRPREARVSYLNAAKYAEAELKVNPSDIRTLAALAVYLQKSGQPALARTRIAEALAKAPDNAEVSFRAAVIHALSGDRDRALTFLEHAAAKGFSRKSIEEDDDLSSLHQSPRFVQLMKE